MRIGELARKTGMNPSALRYYERLGLLPKVVRVGGQRLYSNEAVEKLSLIDVAQRLGFTLEDIALLSRRFKPGKPFSKIWNTMARHKLLELDQLAAGINDVREILAEGLECNCGGIANCPSASKIKSKSLLKRIRLPKTNKRRKFLDNSR